MYISEMDFAAMLWSGNIIAITGTNGKTTLTEFLKKALCNMGKKAIAWQHSDKSTHESH